MNNDTQETSAFMGSPITDEDFQPYRDDPGLYIDNDNINNVNIDSRPAPTINLIETSPIHEGGSVTNFGTSHGLSLNQPTRRLPASPIPIPIPSTSTHSATFRTSTSTRALTLPPSYNTAIPRSASSPPKYATIPTSNETVLLLASPPPFAFTANRCRRCDVENVTQCAVCHQQMRRELERSGPDWVIRTLVVLNCVIWAAVLLTYALDPGSVLEEVPDAIPGVGHAKGYGWALEDYCDVAMRNIR